MNWKVLVGIPLKTNENVTKYPFSEKLAATIPIRVRRRNLEVTCSYLLTQIIGSPYIRPVMPYLAVILTVLLNVISLKTLQETGAVNMATIRRVNTGKRR